MELPGLIVEKLKVFAQSTQDFGTSIIQWHENANRRNPIEILKRLQREAFSDIMKLRDRQDKVERVLSLYKSTKGGPFQEAGSHLNGEVDVTGALLMIGNFAQYSYDAIERAGIKTGINSRFVVETTISERCKFVAELAAADNGLISGTGCPLSVAKVLYATKVSEWLSAIAVPMGACFRDFGVGLIHEEGGLSNYSSFGPPLLNLHNGSAVGVTVRKSNVVASLAQFMSGLAVHPPTAEYLNHFGTFGQIVCQISGSTKLSLAGMYKVTKPDQRINFGALAIPFGIFQRAGSSEMEINADGLPIGRNANRNLDGSIALMLESELDEDTKIGGWIEMKKSDPKYIQWAVSMSDAPEDNFGWGLSLGGLVQGPRSWDHFQIESYLKFNLGKKFLLQPSLLYVMDGTSQFPVIMLRSRWSL